MNTKIFQLNNHAIAIAKRIGNSHAVWFQPSRSFVMFAQPAYKVFCKYAKNIAATEIVKQCQYAFNHPIHQRQAVIFTLIERLNEYFTPANLLEQSTETDLVHQKAAFNIFSIRRYLIGNKYITFIYGNRFLEHCIDPLLAHLTTNILDENDYLFEVFENSGQLVLRCNAEYINSFAINNTHQLIGAVYQQLFSIMYDIKAYNLMMTLHASGISDGKSAILFPAQAGSGKTTLAALLHAKGFPIIADDFMAIDNINMHAFQFPGALSIKEGSMKLLSKHYPLLLSIAISVKAFNEKKVRYMAMENNTPGSPISFPVKAVVFMNYDPGNGLHFEKIEQKAALPLLLAEAWINPIPENVHQFFSWLDTVQFYQLNYSENSHAIESISNIFRS